MKRSNWTTGALALLAVTLVASGAGAKQGAMAKSKLSAADRKFMMGAARGGVAEVELGQLAAKQGADASVKAFGMHMVTDHSKANTKLETLAKTKGVAIKKEMPDEDKPLKTKLAGLHGAAFDKAYRKAMIEDHEKDVAEFAKEAKGGSDSDVRMFAAKTLPTLREHLKSANAMLSGKPHKMSMSGMHHTK